MQRMLACNLSTLKRDKVPLFPLPRLLEKSDLYVSCQMGNTASTSASMCHSDNIH